MKLTRTMLAGALFVLIGGTFLAVGREYPAGTATAMGPGYFPNLVASGVILFGVLAALRSWLRDETKPLELNFRLRPFAALFLSIVAFALLIEPAGLIPALVVTLVLSRLAAPAARPLELLILVASIVALIVGVFSLGLGVPLKLVP